MESVMRTRFAVSPVFPLAVILLALGLFAYWPSFKGVFLFDDIENILNSPAVTGRDAVGALATVQQGRPGARATFALNYRFGKDKVLGYHIVNFTIHFLAAVTLLCLVRRNAQMSAYWKDRPGLADSIAFTAALLWFVH